MAKQDWKDFLSEEAKKELEEILNVAKKHRPAYMQADDTRIAQIWSFLIEMRKEMKELKDIVEKTSLPFKTIIEIGEAAKRKTIERIITEIVKPSEEEKTAVQRLVDSLMKF